VKINPNDMDALIALGVSYTNEMYREEALEALGKRRGGRDRAAARCRRQMHRNKEEQIEIPGEDSDTNTEIQMERAKEVQNNEREERMVHTDLELFIPYSTERWI